MHASGGRWIAGLALVALGLTLAPGPAPRGGLPPPAITALAGAANAAADTLIESPPAPFIVPGREASADTAAINRARRAREQFQLGLELEKINAGAAVVAYRGAVINDPTIHQANYRAGLILASHGMLEQAAQAFTAEIEIDPQHLDANRELAMALSRLGYHDAAIARMESLSVAHPDDDLEWQALGFVYRNAGRTDKAEEALRRAIRVQPRRAIEHRDLGVILASSGRGREARTQYRQALALDDGDPTTWYNLGNLERSEGHLSRALDAYRQSEKRDSSFWLGQRGQIEVLMQLDRPDDVPAVFDRRLARHPDDHEARLAAIRYYEQYGTPEQALELARDGVRKNSFAARAHVILGMTLAKQGQYRDALQSYKAAMQRSLLPKDRSEVQAMIDSLREATPDSLHGMFDPDSLAQRPAVQSKQGAP